MEVQPPFPWMKDKPDTLRHHLENNTGTAFEYTRMKRRDLGKQLLQMRRVYLDMKYWIYARDVYLGRPQRPEHVEIVEELRRLRGCRSTICPVSYSVFNELMYQSDPATRLATAEMIDELSDNCTIQPLFELVKAELYHFFVKTTRPNVALRPVGESVWTKAAFVVGDLFLSLDRTGLAEDQAEAMTKAMDDMLWATKFSEMIAVLPPPSSSSNEIIALAAELTEGKLRNWNPDDTFRKVFLEEVAGVVDSLSDVFGDFMVHIGKEHGFNQSVTDEQKLDTGRMLGRLIHGAFAYDRITAEFPTIDVPAALHAAVRLQKNRTYKKGDTEDFFHAAAAVGYFNVFLTENSLKHLLLSKDVDAGSRYGCVVLSAETEILMYLRSLA